MRLILGYFLAVDFSQQQRALLISSLPASYFKQNECKVSLLFSLTPRTELWSPNEFIIRLVIFWALGVGLGDEGDAGAWNVWFGMGDGVTKWEGGDAPFLRLKLVTVHLWGQCTSERAGTEKNTQECSFLWCWDWAVRNSGPIATQNECKFQIGCPLAVLKTLLWQKTLSEVRIGLSIPSRLFASLRALRLNHLPAMRSLFVWDISQIVWFERKILLVAAIFLDFWMSEPSFSADSSGLSPFTVESCSWWWAEDAMTFFWWDSEC